jgi:N-methylhydantoinase A
VVLEDSEVRVFKIPSTPEHPEEAVLEGLTRIIQDRDSFLIQHGSTVATNALLERRGARTLLITNEGFEDLLEIGRQSRPRLYSLASSRPKPLVAADCRLGVKERTLYDGRSLMALDKRSLDWLRRKVQELEPEAIAVVLLYSYLNPKSEKQIAEALEFAQVPVCLSHQVLPEFREYERTSATVINAYLTTGMSRYLSRLSTHSLIQKGKLTIMQSNGGSVPATSEAVEPLRTLLSGPAGGVVGAFDLMKEAGYEKIITLDMGGTSTDVCLCEEQIVTTNEATIDHQPIPLQMIGIHTVGAGGGSIARIDSGGLLRVGPKSAGADPGPVCYGKGGEITVTDAHLFLGRMDPEHFLGGDLKLYPAKIRAGLQGLGETLGQSSGKTWEAAEIAEGILGIVNTQMEGAIHLISLQKGYDTRDFTLVSFGGAGGLHACELARALLMPRVVVPPDPGMLSALGILRSNVVKDTSLTVILHSQEPDLLTRLKQGFQPLEEAIRRQLSQEGFNEEDILLEQTLDVRYVGQAYELNLPFGDDFDERFHELHQQFYGYSNPGLPMEIVNLRVRGSGRFPQVPIPRFPLESEEPPQDAMIQEKRVFVDGGPVSTAFYLRERLRPGNRLRGPAIILEYGSTTFVPADFKVHIDEWRNLVMEPMGSPD